MNKIKKIVTMGVFLTIVAVVSGCQLAHAQIVEAEDDKLIGLLATFEDLPPSQENIDLSDKISDAMIEAMLNGEEVIMPEWQHKNRIYADLGPQGQYVFPVEGAALIDASYVDEAGVEVTKVDTGIGVTDLHIAVSDTEKDIEATLYVGNKEVILVIFNPVYQSSDGRVYVTPGSSLSFDSYSGARASQTLSETYTLDDNGVVSEERFQVELNIEAKDPIDYVLVKSMNAADEVIDTMRLSKDNLPKAIRRPQGLAYYILEEHGRSQDGEKIIQRRLLDSSEETMVVYFINANNVFEPHSIEVKDEEKTTQ